MLLAQFADNFRAAAAALPVAAAAVPAEPEPAVAEAAASVDAAPAGPALVDAASPMARQAGPAAAATDLPAPRALPATAAKANEINGLAIAWALIKGWFAGLFRKKA
jgi:hypothetical protein